MLKIFVVIVITKMPFIKSYTVHNLEMFLSGFGIHYSAMEKIISFLGLLVEFPQIQVAFSHLPNSPSTASYMLNV